MSIVHLIESNIIFDVNELFFLKIEKSDDPKKFKLVARFKGYNDPIELSNGTEQECKTSLSKLIEHLTHDSTPENTSIQWVYGAYYDILCNLNNVDFVKIEAGVDPDGWHVEACIKNDWENPVSITYSDIHGVHEDMNKVVDGIRFNQKVIVLQGDWHVEDDENEGKKNE